MCWGAGGIITQCYVAKHSRASEDETARHGREWRQSGDPGRHDLWRGKRMRLLLRVIVEMGGKERSSRESLLQKASSLDDVGPSMSVAC